MITLPASPDAFAHATWSDVAPWYEQLATTPLDRDALDAWLDAWSRLEELLGEAGTVAYIAYTADTGDTAREAAYLRFAMDVYPKAEEQQVRLARRLLDFDHPRADLRTTVAEFRTDARIFREANVPLYAEIEELSARYQKITGGLSVDWDGERKTIPQLAPLLKSVDRAERERAFRLGAEAYLAHRDALADTFDRLYTLRQEVARNAGFADYEEYTFQAKHRFDYTPQDCRRFHAAVQATVVPAAARLFDDRRRRLHLDVLRPWDVQVDPDNAPAVQPFADTPAFVAGARRIFDRVDAGLGADFGRMADEGLLDLESRPGKAPGGYCTKLPHRRLPFVFMNAVGIADDVNTLVHEAGHCFHAFLASDHPFIWQRGTGSEAAELASMSMELLAAPYLEAPTGYYSPADARRAQLEHLEDVILSLAHIASVDAFQSWIYTSGEGHDRDARDRAWLEIRARFEQGIDWSGLDEARVSRWLRQLHIFELPFYYIEYGIAQLGALQVWQQAMTDHAAAVARYKAALALGGTATLPEIYAAAGAHLVFDAATMGTLVALVERRIGELRAELEGVLAAEGAGAT